MFTFSYRKLASVAFGSWLFVVAMIFSTLGATTAFADSAATPLFLSFEANDALGAEVAQQSKPGHILGSWYDGADTAIAPTPPPIHDGQVLSFTKSASSYAWSGFTVFDGGSSVTYTNVSYSSITMDYYSPSEGNTPVELKLEIPGNPSKSAYKVVAAAQGWNNLTFDMSSGAKGWSSSVAYNRISIIPNFGGDLPLPGLTAAANSGQKYYFDNISVNGGTLSDVQTGGPIPNPTPTSFAIPLFLSYETDDINGANSTSTGAGLGAFQGASVEIANVPTSGGHSGKGAKFTKVKEGNSYSGYKLIYGGSQYRYTNSAKKVITFDYWASVASPVQVRLETSNGASVVLTEAAIAGWNSLSFDMSTAKGWSVNNSFNLVSIFPDFSDDANFWGSIVAPNNQIFYIDNVSINGGTISDVGEQPSLNPYTSPSAPVITSIAPEDRKLSIYYTAPVSNGGADISYYRVSVDGGKSWINGGLANPIVLTPSMIVTAGNGLMNGRSYDVVIEAVNAADAISTVSNQVSAVPRTVPVKPSINSLTRGDSQFLISVGVIDEGGSPITGYQYSLDGGKTWFDVNPGVSGPNVSFYISGLTNGKTYQVTTRAVNVAGAGEQANVVSSFPIGVPTPPLNVQVGPSDGGVLVSWDAPRNDGGSSIINYTVSALPSGLGCSTAELHCQIYGLQYGVGYTFSVTATNNSGASFSSLSQVFNSSSVPEKVSGLTVLNRTNSNIAFSWTAPYDNGSAIATYIIQESFNGSDWSEIRDLGQIATMNTFTGLDPAVARTIRIAAVNGKGQGPWSDPFLLTTKGAKLVRVTIKDSNGRPVTGGAVTWRMADNSAWSSKTYGLTADGIIDFPYAPAGLVNVTLTNGQLADGSTVSGTWSAILGYDSPVLTVPSNTALSSRTVHVQLPNGYPVANVKVTLTGSGYASTRQNGGFSFMVPSSTLTGFTDTSGNFTVSGFWSGNPSANTLYDDGIITQQQDNVLTSAVTNVELDYMPWVTFDTTQVTGDSGTPQVVQVSAVEAGSSNLLGRHYVTSSKPVKAGVAVTLVPPKGVKITKCANGKSQKLSGFTGANGKAKLTICAYESGVYTLKTSGAASVGSIRVLVKGAAPLAPTSVNVTSPVVGQLRASWNKPLYDGGSPITQYTVTAKAAGKPTVTKVIKATVSKTGAVTKAPATLQVLTGLSNATVYTVTVTATTKNGTSDAYTAKVPVA